MTRKPLGRTLSHSGIRCLFPSMSFIVGSLLLLKPVQAQVYRCGSTFSTKPCEGGNSVVVGDQTPQISKVITGKQQVEPSPRHSKFLTTPQTSAQHGRADVIKEPEGSKCIVQKGAPKVAIEDVTLTRRDLNGDVLLTFLTTARNRSQNSLRSSLALHLITPAGDDKRIPLTSQLDGGEAITEKIMITVNPTEQNELLTGAYRLTLAYHPAGLCEERVIEANKAVIDSTPPAPTDVLRAPQTEPGGKKEPEDPNAP
jgi:hypothetical protein